MAVLNTAVFKILFEYPTSCTKTPCSRRLCSCFVKHPATHLSLSPAGLLASWDTTRDGQPLPATQAPPYHEVGNSCCEWFPRTFSHTSANCEMTACMHAITPISKIYGRDRERGFVQQVCFASSLYNEWHAASETCVTTPKTSTSVLQPFCYRSRHAGCGKTAGVL